MVPPAVVYQIYPRSFQDSNGDGIGDLRGIIARLDHLATLGVDVVWLSPVYASPQDDNGYDISDYQDIDPTFGTLDDFDEAPRAGPCARHPDRHGPRRQPHLGRAPVVRRVTLVEGLPQAGLVLVAPRARGDGAGRARGRADQLGGVLQRLGVGFDQTTGEYYLHLFSRKQPDLNWENPGSARPSTR